jgi:enoyl-CoA hydratase/carnithine racemase
MIAAEMPIDEVPLTTLVDAVRGVSGARLWSPASPPGVLLVDLDVDLGPGPAAGPGLDSGAGAAAPVPALHGGVGAVVVGVTASDPAEAHPAAAVCDVVLTAGDSALDAVAATVESFPVASCALAGLLRGAEQRSTDAGLTAESAVYSALQAGPEFAAWRAARPRRDRPPEGDPVAVERRGDTLHVTLDRPHVRNALNTAMRDRLVDALTLPAVDGTITAVHLWGEGEDFCAGGDLDEFGTFPDPARAHLVRLQQSIGRAIDAVRDRVTVHLHGACIGSGIELPAFAGTVIAAPSTTIALPEVSLGLVPGAGGTVSLPRRIGRHRTARLALAGERIDAAVALSWGLVDAVGAADAG